MSQTYKTFIENGSGYRYQDYTPEFIITGDTDSAYIDLSAVFDRSAKTEDVVSFADNVGKTVNAAFPAYMKAIFNCNDVQSNLVQTEREVVADKGFFSAKKNYMMHVVDKGGVPKDEHKIMGLAIRKSDTPEVVRNFLKKMIEMVMDRESYEKVREYIYAFKAEYMKLPLIDIGRPMNVHNLNKYAMKFAETGGNKGIPYHMRASIFYNSLCGPNDIQIRAGDKIRIVYIKHTDLDYIALPADADVLPDFVTKLQVDWNAQWETVENKIITYLKPIGYDPDSRQKKMLEGLVVF